jgi:hypothetical protein
MTATAPDPTDTKATTVKAVRSTIGTVTVQLGRAVGKMTTDPQTALADLDAAIELLKASRDLYATVTAPES